MKTIYAVLIMALLSLSAAGAWAGSDAGHGAMKGGMDLKKYDVKFNSLDTSRDGALSWGRIQRPFRRSGPQHL